MVSWSTTLFVVLVVCIVVTAESKQDNDNYFPQSFVISRQQLKAEQIKFMKIFTITMFVTALTIVCFAVLVASEDSDVKENKHFEDRVGADLV